MSGDAYDRIVAYYCTAFEYATAASLAGALIGPGLDALKSHEDGLGSFLHPFSVSP